MILCSAHGSRGAEAKFTTGFLLEVEVMKGGLGCADTVFRSAMPLRFLRFQCAAQCGRLGLAEQPSRVSLPFETKSL